jgi:hypothetical protein
VNKYQAKKVIVTEDGTLFEVDELKKYNIKDINGIKFDSKAEAEYYLVLKDKLNRGEIQALTLQPKYILQDKFERNGIKYRRIEYKADFEVMHHGGDPETIDVKGFETKDFKIKKKMFRQVFEDYKLTLVYKKGRNWVEVSA